MKLTHLVLRNFRNYTQCDIGFPQRVNLILGGNAQGKTSLLEAIYFLCTAASHRAYAVSELIQYNAAGFYLKGCLDVTEDPGAADALCLEATKVATGPFTLKKNGVLEPKRSGWLGQCNVVCFSPESLALVKGAPGERRRFLDALLSQVDSRYLADLQQYRSVLKQRNALLKAFGRARGHGTAQLDVWDELLVEAGTAVILKRIQGLQHLRQYALQKHKALTGGREQLRLTYRPAWHPQRETGSRLGAVGRAVDIGLPISTSSETVSYSAQPPRSTGEGKAAEVQELFRDTLRAARETDRRRGTTTAGLHRDDFQLDLETEREGFRVREGARAYGSQGQQRTLALALKLAEVELIRERTGSAPLVLLDDVVSELDDKRAAFLLDVLEQVCAQTFITATQQERLLRHLDAPCVFMVENGHVFCPGASVR